MKNAKWLFLSIMLAFTGVPILTHVVALVLAMVGGGRGADVCWWSGMGR